MQHCKLSFPLLHDLLSNTSKPYLVKLALVGVPARPSIVEPIRSVSTYQAS